jgi:anti-sigma factor RsiW
MNVDLHRDVIVDLLPVYLSGEASAETRRLVESHLAADPDLARLAAEARKNLAVLKPPTHALKEPMTMELENVKRLALFRTLGLAVVFSGLFLATMAFLAAAVLFLRH